MMPAAARLTNDECSLNACAGIMHKTLRRLPSLDFLRGFEAVARRGSFTLAAEELYLTQSALSRQVKALEDALGVALFERRHRSLALTAAGNAFHPAVVEALRGIAAAAERLGTRVEALRVTTTLSFASLWVIPRLPAFRALHPDVEVYLSADDRFVDLARGDVDLAIRYLGENVPGRCAQAVRRADAARRGAGARAARAAAPSRGPRAPRAAALRRPGGPPAVAALADVARGQRCARTQARGGVALLALRPAGPGRGGRAGRGAGPPAAPAGTPRRRQAGRAVPQALRLAARLLRRGGAARGRPRGRRRFRRLPRGPGRAGGRGVAGTPHGHALLGRVPPGRIAGVPCHALHPFLIHGHARDARSLPVDRAIRRAGSARGDASSISRAAAAATRASSRRAVRTSPPSTGMRPPWRHWPASPASRRARGGSRRRALALRRESRSTRSSSSNYLHRPLFAPLLAALAPEGVLLYETFARGNEAFGRPSNPDFLLAPGRAAGAGAGTAPGRRVRAGRVEGGGTDGRGRSASRPSGRPGRGRRSSREAALDVRRLRPQSGNQGRIAHLTSAVSMLTGSLVAIATPMSAGGALDLAALRALIDWHVAERHLGDRHRRHDGRVAHRRPRRAPAADPHGRRARGRPRAGHRRHGRERHARGDRRSPSTRRRSARDSCLSVVPYYNKPTQEGLYRHFRAIAEKVDLPVILYNVPGRTVADLANETVLRLADVPGIVGLKDATADLGRGSELLRGLAAKGKRDFAVYSGEDITALPLMLVGGHGVISVTANVAPRLMSEMCKAALAGDLARARACNDRLLPLHRKLFVEANPIPVKWALAEMGRIANELRLPLVPLSPQYHEVVRAALRDAGVPRVTVTEMSMEARSTSSQRARVAVRRAGRSSASRGARPATVARQAHRLQVHGHVAGARDPARPVHAALRRPLSRRRPAASPRSRRDAARGRRSCPQSADARSCAPAPSAGWWSRRTPEQTWNTTRQFWTDLGFVLAVEQPVIGVMETDWAENRADIPQDVIRKTIGKYIDIFYETYKRDKFRTRVERGVEPGTMEIYISHRGMEQMPTAMIAGRRRSAFAWAVLPPNPDLESEMLSRLHAALRHAGAGGGERRRGDAPPAWVSPRRPMRAHRERRRRRRAARRSTTRSIAPGGASGSHSTAPASPWSIATAATASTSCAMPIRTATWRRPATRAGSRSSCSGRPTRRTVPSSTA